MQEDYILRQEKTGKMYLKILVLSNLTLFLSILIVSVTNGIFRNLIGLLIMIVLCWFIYYGGQISKWIYIVINSLNICSMIYALTIGGLALSSARLLGVLTLVTLVISIVTSAMLIFSKSINEFMHKQRDDYH